MRTGMFLLAVITASTSPGWALAQTGSSVIVNKQRPGQKPPARAATPRTVTQAAAPPAIKPFVLSQVVVEGSSIAPARLETAWRPFLGRSLDGASLVRLADSIGEAENAGGIALYNVAAPSQDFAGGVLRLQVVEGHVDRIEIQGDARAAGLVRAYAVRLTRERPLRRATLQRYVSLIRDIPGLNADLDLKPGTDAGAQTLVVSFKPKAVQFGLAVNNRGTALLGRTQAEGDLFLNGLLRPGDQTRLAIAVPTDIQRFQYYAATHSTPLDANGTTGQVGLSYLRTRPAGTSLEGDAEALSFQVSHPLIRGYVDNLYLTAVIDGLNSNNALLGQTLSNDRTRAVRGGLAYSHATDKTALVAAVTVSQGLDALGARVSDPASSTAAFRKLNLKLAYNVEIVPHWILRLDSSAQLTGDRLPAAEQFALGGEEFGRAYEAAAVVGDEGVAGSAELAWRPAKGLPALLKGSEAYGFVDAGRVTFKSRFGLPAQDARIASAGGGVRLAISEHTLIEAEGAKALRDPDPLTPGGGWRAIFSIKTVY